MYNVHFNPPAAENVCDRCGEGLTHRVDDTEETVKNRLDVYRRQTEPLVEFYRGTSAGIGEVDGDQPVDAVQAAMKSALA